MKPEQIKTIFDQLVDEHLFPELRRHGYRRKAANRYSKKESDNEYQVAARLVLRPGENVGLMNVSAGVAFRKLWNFIKPCGVFARTDIYSATGCGGLVTTMFPKGTHPSWSLIDGARDPNVLGREMMQQFHRYVFSFLEYHANIKHAIDYWKDATEFRAMARVAAMLLLGDRIGAFAEMEGLIDRARDEYEEFGRPVEERRLAQYQQFEEFLKTAIVKT